jgi:hypothetical protein
MAISLRKQSAGLILRKNRGRCHFLPAAPGRLGVLGGRRCLFGPFGLPLNSTSPSLTQKFNNCLKGALAIP